MSDAAAACDAWIDQHLDRYVAELKTYCAVPSISAKNEGLAKCAALVERMLAARGLQTSVLPTAGAPVVIGRAAGRSPRTLLFYNHYDVQPPEPLELWHSPPFAPTVRDGALYARGAKDDKGELVARLAALDAARAAHGGELPCGVLFVVEGQEEIGSPHIAEFVRQHVDLLGCHGSIWEEGGIDVDGSPLIGLGARGILAVELRVQTMGRDAHSGTAHILPSAAWRLVRALAALKGDDERVRIPGFYAAAIPPTSRDMELLDALPPNEDTLRSVYDLQRFVGEASGRELSRRVFEPTCNIQGLVSGYTGEGMKTIVASQAVAKLDFRLVPDQDPDDVFAGLVAFLREQGFADVVATRLGAMWPARTDPADPLVALTARTGQEVYGQPARIVPTSGGSSPIYAFAHPLGGIPVVTAGVGYWDNRTHAPNEHVRLADLANAARHIARILGGFGDL